jgi:outer membrane protein
MDGDEGMPSWRDAVSLFCALILVVAQLAPSAAAQQFQDYSKSKSAFPNVLGPYTSREVPPPVTANTARIDQLIRDGRLILSLDDAIALALENNLDIAIARYNLSIADTDVLKAKSGSQIFGVNTGLVQGTPGGGVGTTSAGGIGTSTTGATGGGAGGTTTGTGGAGTGTSGLVQSTIGAGPPIGSFDPQFTAGVSLEHLTQPTASPFAGAANLKENTGIANFGYQQYFASGTQLGVTFQNQRQTTNSFFTALSPILNNSMRFQFTQHLLQGLSFNANRRFIKIAKNNREISDVSFRNQVINTVSQIENIYWDLVSAYEDVKVKERSLALAQKTLSDNEKQVRVGTLAPIEVVRAQSQVASSQQALIVSQTNLELQELLMKNAVTRNMTDPLLANARVVPTDTMTLPATEPVQPIQDLINDALSHRPEVAQSRIDLNNREITKKSTRNLLRPSVDLVAFYGTSALSGVTNPLSICGVNPRNSSFCVQPNQVRPATGFTDSFSNLWGYNNPDYLVGLNLNIPILNRSAQATQVRSDLEYRQSQLLLLQLENQIAIQVRNAQFTVQQNRAAVEAAKQAEILAAQSLDAEQKKYALGASTNTLVLSAQRDLTQAQSNTVTALASYEKSRVELDRVTGLALTHNGILMADAESGKVQNMPHVPGVTPRANENQISPDVTQPQGAQPQSGLPQGNAPAAPSTATPIPGTEPTPPATNPPPPNGAANPAAPLPPPAAQNPATSPGAPQQTAPPQNTPPPELR